VKIPEKDTIISFAILLFGLYAVFYIGRGLVIDLDCMLFGDQVPGRIEYKQGSKTEKVLVFHHKGKAYVKPMKAEKKIRETEVQISEHFNTYRYLGVKRMTIVIVLESLVLIAFSTFNLKLLRLHFKGKNLNSIFEKPIKH